ncbi:AAA family ATPase [Zavarzinella formosa]|uniref:AAA family ATPase n=1 Tax=Zavarzinella formosa TaxID=360055 RepID=UPI0002F97E36|nr:AAA family ATPase [Zavarzinella formosa]
MNPKVELKSPPRTNEARPDNESKQPPAGGLFTRNLGDIPMKPVKWIVENFVPKGMLTLVAGHGGDGKSSLLAHVAGCVTQGRPAFGLEYECPPPADVLIYNCEDAPSEVMVPRFIAAGADVGRIRLIDGATGPEGKRIAFSLLNVDQLAGEFQRKPFGVLIIDPISSTVGNAGGNDNSETDIRPLLESLSQFAESNGVAVIGVKHLGKGDRENATMRTQGSVAYTSVPRMVLTLAKNPDDPARRILARSKTNLPITGQVGRDGLSFATEPPPGALELVLRHSPGLPANEAATVAAQMYRCCDFQPWEGDIHELASGRQNRETQKEDRSLAKSRAADWLRSFLADGPRHSTDCVSRGNAGIGKAHRLDWWRDDILKGILGGSAFKNGKEWSWRLGADQGHIEPARKEDSHDTHTPSLFLPSLDALKG